MFVKTSSISQITEQGLERVSPNAAAKSKSKLNGHPTESAVGFAPYFTHKAPAVQHYSNQSAEHDEFP